HGDDPGPRLARPGAPRARPGAPAPRRRAEEALADAEGGLVEEEVERRADHDLEDVADHVAGDAAVLGVPSRAPEAEAQGVLDRLPVRAHALRPGRRDERQDELLAARVQLARGPVEPAEREALHLAVETA